MLSVIGYIINSVILFIVIIVVAKLYINFTKKNIEEFPVGPLIKELSELICKNGRKFFPIKEENILLYVLLSTCFILFFIVRAILI